MQPTLPTMLGMAHNCGLHRLCQQIATANSSCSSSVMRLLGAQAAARISGSMPVTANSIACRGQQACTASARMISSSRSACAEHALDEFMRLKRKHAQKQAHAGNTRSRMQQQQSSSWHNCHNIHHNIIFEPLQRGSRRHQQQQYASDGSTRGQSRSQWRQQSQDGASATWHQPNQHRTRHAEHTKHHPQHAKQRHGTRPWDRQASRHAQQYRQYRQQDPSRRRQRRTFSAAYGYDTKWWRRYWRMDERDLSDEDDSDSDYSSDSDADWEDWVEAYLRNLRPDTTSSRQSFHQSTADDRAWYDTQWSSSRAQGQGNSSSSSSSRHQNGSSSSKYRSNSKHSSNNSSWWDKQQDEASWAGYKEGAHWWERYRRAAGQAAGGAAAGGWGSGAGMGFGWGGAGGTGTAGAGRSSAPGQQHPAHVVAHLAALGLAPTTQLQAPALKSAFHKCAMQWHPDRWANADSNSGAALTAQQAAEKFKAAYAAYEALRTLC